VVIKHGNRTTIAPSICQGDIITFVFSFGAQEMKGYKRATIGSNAMLDRGRSGDMRSGVEGGIYKKFTESEQHQHSPVASPAAAPESDLCNCEDRNIKRICEVKVPAQAVQMFDSHWVPLDQT